MKSQDLSSVLELVWKWQAWWCTLVICVLGRQAEAPWSQTAYLLTVDQRDTVSQNRRLRHLSHYIWGGPLASACMHAYICACTYTHRDTHTLYITYIHREREGHSCIHMHSCAQNSLLAFSFSIHWSKRFLSCSKLPDTISNLQVLFRPRSPKCLSTPVESPWLLTWTLLGQICLDKSGVKTQLSTEDA